MTTKLETLLEKQLKLLEDLYDFPAMKANQDRHYLEFLMFIRDASEMSFNFEEESGNQINVSKNFKDQSDSIAKVAKTKGLKYVLTFKSSGIQASFLGLDKFGSYLKDNTEDEELLVPIVRDGTQLFDKIFNESYCV